MQFLKGYHGLSVFLKLYSRPLQNYFPKKLVPASYGNILEWTIIIIFFKAGKSRRN